MNVDLQTLFDQAGHDAPTHHLDCDKIIARGRRARFRRRALIGATAVAAGGAGILGLSALELAGAGSGTAATPASPVSGSHAAFGPASNRATSQPTSQPTPLGSSAAASPVLTVAPGAKVDIGGGSYLTVTTTQKCLVLADPPNRPTTQCTSPTQGNQATKSLSVQAARAGWGKPTIITGVYTGTDAARITITTGHVTRAATIVTIDSHPGFLVYFLMTPAAVSPDNTVVEAFTRDGRQLSRSE